MPLNKRRLVYLLWPSWLAVILVVIANFAVRLWGKWPALGLDVAGVSLEVLTYWRLRPLIRNYLLQRRSAHDS